MLAQGDLWSQAGGISHWVPDLRLLFILMTEPISPDEGMTPTAFIATALPYAQEASAATHVLVSVVLAQWIIETGWGGYDWTVAHNPGNVGSFDGQPINVFPDLPTGVRAYIQCMDQGYYAAVRSGVGYLVQCVALGHSPWASGHYLLNGLPGGSLINMIQAHNLTQYDGASPQPTPAPSPTNPVPAGGGFMIPTGCTDTEAVRAQIREWWTTYRSDVMTADHLNLFQYCFYLPQGSGGWSGNPDLLLAAIIDQAGPALRPMWVNAV